MAVADWGTEGDVLYRRDGAVARLTINRPERRNAMSPAVVTLLRRGVAEAKADPEARVLVLTGAGDRAFCAGADLVGQPPGYLEAHDSRGEFTHLLQEIWELGKPTIARVRGFAVAGGFGLALACDLVVAAEDATFGAPELDVGLWPYIITVPLVRSMPPKKALELILTCRRVGAAEAEAIGFVNRVVPVGELDAAVDELTTTLVAKPPGTLRLGRDAFYSVWDLGAADALRYLHSMLTITAQTDEAKEGSAAFAEKRPPSWRA